MTTSPRPDDPDRSRDPEPDQRPVTRLGVRRILDLEERGAINEIEFIPTLVEHFRLDDPHFELEALSPDIVARMVDWVERVKVRGMLVPSPAFSPNHIHAMAALFEQHERKGA